MIRILNVLRSSRAGVTLVEALIGAAIVMLSLIAVVAFVCKGQEQVTVDKHRRVARAILERTIEDLQFDRENYPNLVTRDTTFAITIDTRTTPPLAGAVRVAIGNELAMTGAGASAVVVPYRKILTIVVWTEFGRSVLDTIRAEKWITHGSNL